MTPLMVVFNVWYFPPRITLEIMTLQPKCEDVETAEGVAITVTGVAQVNTQSSFTVVSLNMFVDFPPFA